MEPTEQIKIYDKGVVNNPDYASYGEALNLRFGDVTVPYSMRNVAPLLSSTMNAYRGLTQFNPLTVLMVPIMSTISTRLRQPMAAVTGCKPI